jgi:hypothetical protein
VAVRAILFSFWLAGFLNYYYAVLFQLVAEEDLVKEKELDFVVGSDFATNFQKNYVVGRIVCGTANLLRVVLVVC